MSRDVTGDSKKLSRDEMKLIADEYMNDVLPHLDKFLSKHGDYIKSFDVSKGKIWNVFPVITDQLNQ